MGKKKKNNDECKVRVDENASLRDRLAEGKTNRMLGIHKKMSPKQRKKKMEIFERRMEVSKLMVEYGYNDPTIAKILGVSTPTIKSDREWLHSLWMEHAIDNTEEAKATLIRRKSFVLEESRRAWDKSKSKSRSSKTKKKTVKGSGKKGNASEKEEVETVKDELGNSKYLEMFDKVSEDIARLQGLEMDNIKQEINIHLPDLPKEFEKYGVPVSNDEAKTNREVEEAEDVDYVDIQSPEEEDIRKNHAKK